MRVHVISDMEGVAGIVKWGQTTGGETKLYQEGRVLYTEEINAAVRGAKAAGATEIVVMDCHGAGGDYTFNSLVPDLLDPDCEYVVQSEWTEYTELPRAGLRRGAVRRHARDGGQPRRRPLAHRLRPGVAEPPLQRDARRRDRDQRRALRPLGLPGRCSSPATARCARRGVRCSASGLTTVEVKVGLGRFSARQKTPQRARELIEAGAKQALSDLSAVEPYDPGRPCEIEIEFTLAGPAAGVSRTARASR